MTEPHKIGRSNCKSRNKRGGQPLKADKQVFLWKSAPIYGMTGQCIMKNQTKTVKGCKNCTISEVWVQITGMPDKISPADQYSLLNSLKKVFEKKHQLQCGLRKGWPVLLNAETGQHDLDICPPFWNGEIRWTENSQKKILRIGHQFFAFHSLFDKYNSYNSYKLSFETTFQKIISSLEDSQVFKAAELKFKYVNTINLQTKTNGEFDLRDYFNAGFFYNLKHPFSVKHSNFSYEFNSKKSGIIINVNTSIKTKEPGKSFLTAVIETAGTDLLQENLKLNNKTIIKKTKAIKEEIKTMFFDFMTDNTKENIMEVRYA